MADTRGGIVVRDLRGERRDPTAGTVNLSYSSNGAPMLPQWDAAAAQRSAYYANIFVYRCVQVRARALAALPFRVGADPDRPKDFNPKAPLAQLLGPPPGGPNPTTTARKLWAWTLAQKIVTGRFGWEIEKDQTDRALPLGLYPLPTSRLKAIPTTSGQQYFSGYKFGPPNKERPLTADQVVYAWNPSQDDWREPESALQAARLDISVAVMQNRYDYAFLKNDARPAAVVVTQAFGDDDEYDAFKDQFQSNHGGPDNAGKVAFLEADGGEEGSVVGAIDIKVLGLSQKDAQFLERENQKIRAICVALGVPLSKLGDASSRTFNNAGQEHANFETDTLIPDAHDLEDDINLLLAPLFGDGLVGWFDLSGLKSQQSSRFQPVSLLEAYKAGLIDEAESRSEIGYAPRDETAPAPVDEEPPSGSLLERAQAFNYLATTLTPESAAALTGFPLDQIEAKAPPPAPAAPLVIPALGTGDGGVSASAVPDRTHTATGIRAGRCGLCSLPLDHTIHALRTSDRAAEGEARRTAAWKDMDARATALEHTFAGQMRRLFERQASSVVQRLTNDRSKTGRGTRSPDSEAKRVFDQAYWEAETAAAASPLYETITAQGGYNIAARFGGVFDIASTVAQQFIQARANQLAGQVTDTTYSQIRDALAQGVADGLGMDDLARAVRDVFDGASKVRAVTIARTEVVSAYNGAQDMQAAQLPADVVAGKEWIATRDDRVRDAHAAADGQTVTVDSAFTVEDEDLQYPGDPSGSAGNIIQCRCTVGYLTPDEMPDPPARGRALPAVEYRIATRLLRELVSA